MFRDYIEQQGLTDEYSLTAAEHIDALTFNRIVDFEKLTDFQQKTLMRAHEKLENFERENEDILDSNLNSYGINNVSMSFGNKLQTVCGITVSSDIYSLLTSTGLCYTAI